VLHVRFAKMAVTALLLLLHVSANSEQNKFSKEEYARAIQAIERGDYKTATHIFSQLAERGQVEAQTAQGIKYDKGLGVPQNYKKAVNLFRQAAEKNDPIAQYHLGVKYVNGHGVKQNPLEAYVWFAIAFNNGNEMAADPLRVLNQSLSTVDRQNALKVVVKKMEDLEK